VVGEQQRSAEARQATRAETGETHQGASLSRHDHRGAVFHAADDHCARVYSRRRWAMKKNYKFAKITQRTPKEKLTQAFECACGKEERLGVYVFAHYQDKLLHTCDCGRVNVIQNGVVLTPVKAPKKKWVKPQLKFQ
jgi:hypothetical protein